MFKNLFFVIVMLTTTESYAVINVISDVNWDCMFPMTVMGLQSGSSDSSNNSNGGQGNSSVICSCAAEGQAKIGIPIGFWEPFAMVDTTSKAWELLPFGINLGLADPYMLEGAREAGGDVRQRVQTFIITLSLSSKYWICFMIYLV